MTTSRPPGNGNGLWLKVLGGLLACVLTVVTMLATVWAVIARPLETRMQSNEDKIHAVASDVATVDRRVSTLPPIDEQIATIRRDIVELIGRIDRERDLRIDHGQDIGRVVVTLNEIERQFGKTSAIINMRLEESFRRDALLWNRVYGEPLPVDLYMPTIGNGESVFD